MRLSNRQLSLVTISVFIVFVITGAVLKRYFSSQMAPKQFLQMNVSVDCNPRTQSCLASYAKRSITLKLDESVHYLKPFQVKVFSHGFEKSVIKHITAAFSMLDMEMGLNQFKMFEIKPGQWQGQVILPVCSSGRTDWKVEVWLETDEVHYRAEYQLKVD